MHRRIHLAYGEYLLRTPEIRKSTPEGAVIRTPDLLAHRPFDFTTGLGEPSEGQGFSLGFKDLQTGVK